MRNPKICKFTLSEWRNREQTASESGQVLLSCLDYKYNSRERGGEAHTDRFVSMQSAWERSYSMTQKTLLKAVLSWAAACATLQVRPVIKDADWCLNQAVSHPSWAPMVARRMCLTHLQPQGAKWPKGSGAVLWDLPAFAPRHASYTGHSEQIVKAGRDTKTGPFLEDTGLLWLWLKDSVLAFLKLCLVV